MGNGINVAKLLVDIERLDSVLVLWLAGNILLSDTLSLHVEESLCPNTFLFTQPHYLLENRSQHDFVKDTF